MKKLNIEENDKILIVSPHPDDECIGCGGIIALYPKQCDVLLVTDGSAADENIEHDKMKDIRKQEFTDEMNLAGIIRFRCLDYVDSTLVNHPNCFADVRFDNYSKVFLPMIMDQHHDHVATYCYAMKEMRKKQVKDVEIYQYEVQTLIKYPTHFIDISSVIDKKKKLINCHKSQISIYDYLEWTKTRDGHFHNYLMPEDGQYTEVYKEVSLSDDEYEDYAIRNALFKQRGMATEKVLSLWINQLIKWGTIGKMLINKGVTNASIYGFGELGKILYQDLISGGIEVRYIIDKKENSDKLPLVKPRCITEVLDTDCCIIIAVLNTYLDIKRSLIEKGYYNILILQDLLREEMIQDEAFDTNR